MFTGIVEEVGEVRSIDRRATLQRTTISAEVVLDGTKVGDSISINGVCHTAVQVSSDVFVVESVFETLNRTTVGKLTTGDGVNLERSIRLSDRLDGHLVQGHVDGIGEVVARDAFDDNVNFTVEVEGRIGRYIAEKGSVAIDGVSLTVVDVRDSVNRSRFSVTIIPHTLSMTTMQDRDPGDAVNIEVDVVARYLERLVQIGQTEEGTLTWSSLTSMGYQQQKQGLPDE
ncbi:MAG: riboflavin synthase [Gemmatimonadetes bacterium]|jgi:riboflavin synthase|nr:riboflavin synthase [Gemmatimonadota bacterium]MBE85300.1 riboflavin synthase [Gemmatimonadota bacterium]HCK12309.1 riboflavin synthase [Candidatus Latescibacterota bacterium]